MKNKVKVHRIERRNGPVHFLEEEEITVSFITLVCIAFGILCIIGAIRRIDENVAILLFPMGLLSLVFSFDFYSNFIADYIIDEAGVYAKYPFQSWKLIPWSAFQEVCVCYGSYNAKTCSAFTYICFVKQGEKKNHMGRWKVDYIFHHRRIITLDYTKKLVEEVRRKCPYEVSDLRGTGTYRL